jgi:hypothetical protein
VGLLTLPFRLPLLPVRGFIRLAQVLQEQAEQELYDPASVKRQLEDLEEAEQRGELSDEEIRELENQTVGRLVEQKPGAASPGGPRSGEER